MDHAGWCKVQTTVLAYFLERETTIRPTWRAAERPDGALVQRIFDAGALCDADEPTQTIRFLLTLSPPPPTDGGDAPPPPPPQQIVHEEDCDDTLTRPLLLEELARRCDAHNAAAASRPFPLGWPIWTRHPALLEVRVSL